MIFRGLVFMIVNTGAEEANLLKHIIRAFGGAVSSEYTDLVNIVLIGEQGSDVQFDCLCLMTSYIVYCEAFCYAIDNSKFNYAHLPKIKESQQGSREHTDFMNEFNYTTIFNKEKEDIKRFYSEANASEFLISII